MINKYLNRKRFIRYCEFWILKPSDLADATEEEVKAMIKEKLSDLSKDDLNGFIEDYLYD